MLLLCYGIISGFDFDFGMPIPTIRAMHDGHIPDSENWRTVLAEYEEREVCEVISLPHTAVLIIKDSMGYVETLNKPLFTETGPIWDSHLATFCHMCQIPVSWIPRASWILIDDEYGEC